MDGERFDAMARGLAAGADRRRLLGGLLGGALGLLGVGGAGAEHGSCRHAGAACTRDRQCCSGDCLGNGTCRCARASQCPQATEPCQKAVCTATGRCAIRDKADGTACDGGACWGGTCGCSAHSQCPPPADPTCQQAACSVTGQCVIRNKTDGTACDGGTCQGGTCVAGCPPDEFTCPEGAVDTCCPAGTVDCCPPLPGWPNDPGSSCITEAHVCCTVEEGGSACPVGTTCCPPTGCCQPGQSCCETDADCGSGGLCDNNCCVGGSGVAAAGASRRRLGT